MIKPAHTEVEAADILVFSGGGDSFIHGRKRFSKETKVGLENGHVEKGILIVALVSCLHRVVEVAMQVLKSSGIIPGSPSVKESKCLNLALFAGVVQ